MDVSVVVATFGSSEWRDLAWSRAIPSVPEGVPAIHRHADSLHQARNEGLRLVNTEWVIFLDADDELEPGYIEAMARGTADVRGPIARYVTGSRERLWQPRVFGHEHDCEAGCLVDGNWLIVGSAVRTELVEKVGGWESWPVYEDWALWARIWRAGATFELIRDAVYRAHVDPAGRNRGPAQEFKNRTHQQIHEAVFPELHQVAA